MLAETSDKMINIGLTNRGHWRPEMAEERRVVTFQGAFRSEQSSQREGSSSAS
jgi:hypothetical protein